MIEDFFVAAQKGDVDFIKRHLDYKGNVNESSVSGVNALMIATRHARFSVVQLLVERGVRMNDVDRDGWTAFYRSAMEGHLLIAKYLLKKGADISIRSNIGNSSLSTALGYNRQNVVLLLVKHAEKLDSEDRKKIKNLRFKCKFEKIYV